MRLSSAEIKVIDNFFQEKPDILKAYVFGSYARGEADDKSDVDIMIELRPNHGMGLDFFGLGPELKKQLGKEVDVTTISGLSQYVIKHVMSDRKLIYERSK